MPALIQETKGRRSASLLNNVTTVRAGTAGAGSLGNALAKLAAELTISRGADGPAALVISEQQRAEVSALRQAILGRGNTNTAVETEANGAVSTVGNAEDKDALAKFALMQVQMGMARQIGLASEFNELLD